MTEATAGGSQPIERDPRKGVILMLVSIALFSVMNGMVKDEAMTFPANQIVFFLEFTRTARARGTALGDRWLHEIKNAVPRSSGRACRDLHLLACLQFHGLRHDAARRIDRHILSVAAYCHAAGRVLLREKVTLTGWVAVIGGFLGVMLIVRPGAIHVNLLRRLRLDLRVAFIGAINLLQQRRLSLTDDTITILFWFLTLSTLYLLPTLFIWWVPPNGHQLLGLVTMGLASGLFQYVCLRPLYYANASTLAPARYTNMLWAISIGFLWFGRPSDVTMLIGSAIVMASTALTLRRKPEAVSAGDKFSWWFQRMFGRQD